MKQVKIEFEKCKKKMPNRPPDEIDFGLGFRAGLRFVLKDCEYTDPYGQSNFDSDKMKEELQ